jgi:DNA-binding transcriptional LysR family regulator
MTPRHGRQAAARPLGRQVDLNLLELFEAIHHARNLTAAGVQLGLTQSAVSRGLGRLRQMYGDPLFVRQQRGVLPTPAADALAAPVSEALDILRATLQAPAFDPAHANRTFRIAMSDIGERLFIARLAGYLAQHAPGMVIEAVPPSDGQLQDRLASGEVDMAVS